MAGIIAACSSKKSHMHVLFRGPYNMFFALAPKCSLEMNQQTQRPVIPLVPPFLSF